MDTGKRRFRLGRSTKQDTDPIVADLVLLANGLQSELAVIPGFTTLLCSVPIARGQAVSILNGQWQLADAATLIPAIGICVNAGAAGAPARCIIGSGFATGLSGLTANASIYLGNAGAILFAKPGAGMIQGLGIALSTTDMFVTISQP